MALLKRDTGQRHEVSGEPVYEYYSDTPDQPSHRFAVKASHWSPAFRGTLVLEDGTPYSIDDDVIEAASPEHTYALAFQHAKVMERTGELTKLCHPPDTTQHPDCAVVVHGDEAAAVAAGQAHAAGTPSHIVKLVHSTQCTTVQEDTTGQHLGPSS